MLKKNIDKMSEIEKREAKKAFEKYESLLFEIYLGATERAIKAMFITNGGATVAILAYLHGLGTTAPRNLWGALGCFVLGLIIAVVLVGIDYYICLKNMNNFRARVGKFHMGEANLNETFILNQSRFLTWILIVSGFISGLLFIVGCLIFGCYIASCN